MLIEQRNLSVNRQGVISKQCKLCGKDLQGSYCMDTTCTVGIGDYRQLALGKQHYRYKHINYIGRLDRLNKSCIGIGIAD